MGSLIGLGGLKESGKDAVADWLVENKNFVKFGMSDDLNAAMLILNPWIKPSFPVYVGARRLKTWEPIRYRELHDAVGYVEAKRHDEVRIFLQDLGTGVGRNMLGEDIWVDAVRRKILEELDAGKNVVLTALRFPNELAMFDDIPGITAWVERSAESRSKGLKEPLSTWSTTEASEAATEAHRATESHVSENSVNASQFDIVINNDGTLEELYAKAEDLASQALSAPRVSQFFPVYDR